MVLTTLLYACETRRVYQRHAKRLNHFHLSCFRNLLKIKWQDKSPDTEVLKKAKTNGPPADSMTLTCSTCNRQLRARIGLVSHQRTHQRTRTQEMSHLMGKPTICICENKGADQLRSNCEADQRLCFRYTDSTIPLLSKSRSSSL